MHARKILIAIYWIAIVIAPFLISFLAITFIPAGAEQIPMQVGWDGEVNRWGSPSEMLIVGAIMSGCNLLLALCYLFNDFLYDHGLVHGVSKKGALAVYDVVGVVITVTTAWVCWFLLSKI